VVKVIRPTPSAISSFDEESFDDDSSGEESFDEE
jgi:hypothetical protein